MSEHPGTATRTVERQARLAELFVLLADSLVDDFDVIEVLDELARACVELLGATAAALMLVEPRGGLGIVAASDARAQLLEVFQLQDREGPCLDCVRTGRSVMGIVLEQEQQRWPVFAPSALALGFRSVNAFPLRLRSQTIGGLNLFHETEEPLQPGDVRIAQALADTASIGILHQRALHQSNAVADQLQRALDSRIVIEQAKGMLAEFAGIELEAAFALLRQFCRDHNLRLSVTARQLAERTLPLSVVVRHQPGTG